MNGLNVKLEISGAEEMINEMNEINKLLFEARKKLDNLLVGMEYNIKTPPRGGGDNTKKISDAGKA